MGDGHRLGWRGWLALAAGLLLLAALGGGLSGTPAAPVGAAADPVLAAAGDIACDPGDPDFNGGAGAAGTCHMGAVSDLLAGGGLAGVLALGDDQYDDATLAKFQQSYDPGWGRVKALTHPVPGNHEYKADPAAAGYFGYYGAAAGDPARGYYSFDLGAWHLVVLNANCAAVGGCQAGSAQEQWLRADLAAHPAACTLAAWHQPRFSSGFVGGTTDVAAFWDDLYAARAALVLNGHDHDYERFAPQDPGGAADPARGIREFVVGTGGKDLNHGFAAPLATSEVRDAATFGALRLTLHPTGYDWQFVPDASGTFTDAGSGACPVAASPSPSASPSASPSPSPSASPSPSSSPSPAVRVRAGLGAYTDKAGKAWAADSGFTGGSTSTTGAAIAGTADPALYQGERWGDFSYRFAVPNGTYTVTLKFAEIYWTQPGQRVFNVALNGQAALTNFDILAQVAPNTALDKSFTVTVTGGTLTAAFTTVTDAAKLSAIAIVPGTGASPSPSASPSASPSPSPSASPSPRPSPSPSASPSPSPSPSPSASPSASPSPSPSASPSPSSSPSPAVRVRAGLGAYTDKAGKAWAADSGFTGGSTSTTGAAIAGTADPALYQGERWGDFSYRFAVPNGTYTVTLKFAEIYWTQPGQRVFNVALNGQAALTNFDILAQVAPNTALDKSFTVTVTGGTLTAAFTTVTDAAKLSAIAIVPGTGASPSPSASPSASPSPSPSPRPSPSPSASPSASPSPSPSPRPSASPSPSPSASPSPSSSPSPAVRVRAGLGAYTDKAGKAWAADSGFTGGSTSTTGAAIAGTADPALYQGERWGDFSYRFAVPNGTYTVTLKFAEIYWTQPGQRVFNVALNGQAALTNFDILAQVAPNTALDKSFTVTVTGGTLTAAFTTVTDAAKLSAIAIVPGTSANAVPQNRIGGVLNDARDPATFPGRGIGGIARDRQPSEPEFTLVEMSITESTGRLSRYTGAKIASSPSIQAATVSRATG